MEMELYFCGFFPSAAAAAASTSLLCPVLSRSSLTLASTIHVHLSLVHYYPLPLLFRHQCPLSSLSECHCECWLPVHLSRFERSKIRNFLINVVNPRTSKCYVVQVLNIFRPEELATWMSVSHIKLLKTGHGNGISRTGLDQTRLHARPYFKSFLKEISEFSWHIIKHIKYNEKRA